ncbi:hydantoinase B/oxoprolinase family protein [Martelella mediterranea]|uniref:N-methylhydantoinase B n=1 Tax=Martelella mediterranea TaxID=293089 RepID=A0A4R3NTH9_9HYPH|nr:hydantoinase B/oxoprolinase family protein [Martelella mediterranea]TCT39855.1 N-methylhydantoinase B [Martelella mediterranea]
MTAIKDPITLEIIQNSLQATADEMFAAMRKTAMSSIIYEVLDMGTGVLDAKGQLASSGAGIPGFVGVLDKSVKVLAEKFSRPGDIEPGDVFITNDPYYGGVTHLNDLIVAMPVFVDGTLIAWTANIAHNSDIGGMAPGSMSADAREIFQEGLRLPAIKLISKGEPIKPLFEVIMVNSRMPDFIEGDLWAAIASVRIGAKRLAELAGKYGVETFQTAVENFITVGEQKSRAEIAKLPNGTFELTEEQDDGSFFNVKLTITEDEFIVDLRDNPEQGDGPFNASFDDALVSTQVAFKSLTDSALSANEGTFRPVKLLTREGTVFHAKEPAAVGFYYEVGIRVYDLICRCLAPHMDGRIPAGHFASIAGTFIGGIHPDTGRQYTIIEPQIGGWGAEKGYDGNSAIFSAVHGETFNCPAEISEARNGLIIDRMELNLEEGGEGQWTGGRGIKLDYRIRRDDSFLTIGYTRSKMKPWSLDGGNEGSNNYALVRRKDGSEERYAFISGLRVDKDDVIRIMTGAGGGYGDPKKRDPEKVRQDIKNGLISAERAAEVHGVS